MDTTNSNANLPDSWDSIEDPGPGEDSSISTQFKKLNVNATPFVPNVFAPAFVPASAKPPQTQVSEEATSTLESVRDEKHENDTQMNTENTDINTATQEQTTHAQETTDEPMEEEEEEVPLETKAKPKKKPEVLPEEEEDTREHVNIIFIGHVDAGKSTIGGHVMYLTGQVDKRTLEKYEREAKEKNRETWYLSWALDTNQEERDKGKTVEVGRAAFDTAKKHFTLLDAPGHKSFVPNMISGAAQADLGVLVISARKGEFETGFERGGQTREHAMLAKTAGVKHLVVLVNKMDDQTVEWSEERYEEIKVKLTPFLKKVGFNPKTDIMYMPCSGLTGANIKESLDPKVCPWYSGKPFLTYIDELPSLGRSVDGPVRIPVADKYREMGTIILGKVESGRINKGQSLILMPNKVNVEILTVIYDDEEMNNAKAGDNVKLRLKGVEEEDVSPGFVLCSPDSLCHTVRTFDAQVVILEHKSIICAGYKAVLHIHNVVEEVSFVALIGLIDKKTGKKVPERPRFIKQDQVAIARLQTSGVICIEKFADFQQMGRFTLRDEGKTIGIGKVLKLVGQ
ncbi:eukaryotic peptide chain release factor GTP-binding subunit ERF3A [Exaiptasia diaphana]|uniref:Tr-type G domain-containing protein n=1 Tax=Exaiptasia diaphana TaxID=2652724 RepID=A0A913XA92_EXADI|nr:eukaryotic peptide chain release factor GTP-binding subunit ERF3A [Exaiptasia diaphana]KXJ26621.1 Eukaryotic peptide chain release factor GTP-binding subunit ERF3B [Exaiptasia diaphana]